MKIVNRFSAYLPIIGAFFLGGVLLAFWGYLHFPIALSAFDREQSLIITDRAGGKMYEILSNNSEKSQEINYKSVSPYFFQALIATEDQRFYRHQGVDFFGVLRALRDNLAAGKVVSGASTISQQVAKSLLSHQKRGLKEKLAEIALALRLEKQLAKEEILELYINKVSFGDIYTGIESASFGIFGKTAKNLDLAEAAFLAGVLKSPTRYSPFNAFEAAKKRQVFVLRRMQEEGLISAAEEATAVAEELIILSRKNRIEAPHFVFFVLNSYSETIKELMQKRQKTVKTTLNLALQKQIERIIESHLRLIGAQHNISNAAALVFEVESGKIRAMVGSKDFFDHEIAGEVNILTAPRQVGSTLKPFLYLLAFQSLGWHGATTILDEPVGFDTTLSAAWEPKNYDLAFRGEVSVRAALAQSLNIPAAKTLQAVGAKRFIAFLADFGIKIPAEEGDYGLSVALGTPSIRPLDLARAYGILARGGRDLVLQVFEDDKTETSARQVADREKAWEIIDIMSDKKARIDAFGEDSPLDFSFPVAAKTGTTRNFRDNYAIGFTPQIVVLVWVGNADGTPMREVSGITGAGPLLNKIMNLAMRDYQQTGFEKPSATETGAATDFGEEVGGLRVLYPLAGSRFKIDPTLPPTAQKIRFTANEACSWFLGGEALGEGEEVFWTPRRGDHVLEAVLNEERVERRFSVE